MAGRDQPGSCAQDCSAPPPACGYPFLEGQGWEGGSGVHLGCPQVGAGWGILLQTLICFTTSSLPCSPHVSLLSAGPCATRARDRGALPRARPLGQWLCSVPYLPWGEGGWLEDWNLNAVVFDSVTFLLGRVSPPFLLLSMSANAPLSWSSPSTLQPRECHCGRVQRSLGGTEP